MHRQTGWVPLGKFSRQWSRMQRPGEGLVNQAFLKDAFWSFKPRQVHQNLREKSNHSASSQPSGGEAFTRAGSCFHPQGTRLEQERQAPRTVQTHHEMTGGLHAQQGLNSPPCSQQRVWTGRSQSDVWNFQFLFYFLILFLNCLPLGCFKPNPDSSMPRP